MTGPPRCQAKIRPFLGRATVQCISTGAQPHDRHEGLLLDLAYLGSETHIIWFDEDRRTFYGEWEPCTSPDCILPSRHHGGHAI